jgi:hypothetical protein
MSDLDDPLSEAFRLSGKIYSPETSDYSRFGDWQTKAIYGALIIIACLIGLATAHARDPSGKYANAPHAQWYRSQHNAAGLWCCDEADGHPYYGDYTLNQDGSVIVEGEKIEKYKVLTGPNPTGHAVWWWVGVGGGRQTYCFAPGTLG